MKKIIITAICILFISQITFAQVGTKGEDRNEEGRPVKEYNLTIEQNEKTLGGVTAKAMSINGSIPGPVLEFIEGDLAIINVINKMDEETSVHWHGIILPNFFDGVPYLNTPPIKPETTFQYRIPINQSGTYWYHSHTMLQEQKGVYGAIIIQPKEKSLQYDKDLAIVLSDWTNEKPMNVLRNLKRGNEWYQVKKGTAVPLSRAIVQGGFGAQLKMWRDRMEGADIADIYYPAFLSNGKKLLEYPAFKPGEKVRLRLINASASTYYWMDFGAGNPMVVASDGVDVQPIHKNRFLFAIAETYDVIVTIPEGQLEIIATAQDGSGHTTIRMGNGKLFPAEKIKPPNKVEMMMDIDDDNMGNQKDGDKPMDERINMEQMNHNAMQHKDTTGDYTHNERMTYFNYNFLKAKEKTTFNPDIPVNELLLNLTGNMNRYVWSLNGIPLSEADNIIIKGGEVTRITLNNLTMMHHPMHLHGHYFRVINENGEHSPLKHTVNVPPMQKVTIEFYNEEYGDWFFHCHVLYHMMGGMARVFSYDTPRDERLENFPVQELIDETDHYYSWGLAVLSSNFSELSFTSSNIRNEFNIRIETDYNQNSELEVSYNRYLNDWVRIYAGVNSENEIPDSYDEFNTVGLAGVKYFTPYMFNVDVSIDHQLRPRVRLDKEILLFPRIFLEGEYEYRADFGWVNDLEENKKSFEGEDEWLIRASYIVSRNFSIQANYNSHYGWGGGLSVRF
ncbi:MAG: multicopper oxidase domain-containing protein [Candidatus Delongbacteria bacterium]|jgi:FtsP/CotA-like multicopper oxidase with cupredoxin domain|nr:multicopper oxidase domain-containing protein [Candidatus Delongbacteria bacterium]